MYLSDKSEKAAYSAAIFLYGLAIRLAAPFHPKARKWVRGRKEAKAPLLSVQERQFKWIWVHCSSMGEFRDGAEVIRQLKARGNHKLLLSFSSPSGYEYYSGTAEADKYIYLPPDTAANAKRFLDSLSPVMALFIRNDIWMNYLQELKSRNIPVFLVSFTLNAGSGFLKWPFAALYRKCFSCFTAIFVQDAGSERLLLGKGFNRNIVVAGNCRVDQVLKSRNAFADLLPAAFFEGKEMCVVMGSITSKELSLCLDVIGQDTAQRVAWIIVPHELHARELEAAEKRLLGMLIYSRLDARSAGNSLWVDKVGILSGLYGFADMAYVGGGFNRHGVHNILEPAVHGCFICLGPNYREYVEAKEMIGAGGAVVIRSAKELTGLVKRLQKEKEAMKKKGAQNAVYVGASQGAAAKVVSGILPYLTGTP